MEAATYKALCDKTYDVRKQAALDLERQVRQAGVAEDTKKLHNIIAQLCEMSAGQLTQVRSGGLLGLAGISIALGGKISEYLAAIVPPILSAFMDPDGKVRYFALESMYNISKVAKGEILIFFNELFDAMSKLAADTEPPVKNGVELLDRLIKDIVAEEAATYVSVMTYPDVPTSPQPSTSASVVNEGGEAEKEPHPVQERAFSLPRFIPLLCERVYVLNPYTRTFLVSWLTVLDSVPELELVTYLPEFLDGLLKYLGDPSMDVRVGTQNVLADFLKEIRDIAEVQRVREDGTVGTEKDDEDEKVISRKMSESSLVDKGKETEEGSDAGEPEDATDEETASHEVAIRQDEGEGTGAWVPGKGVVVDHAAIVEILLEHLSYTDDEVQSTCLRWVAEFLNFAQSTMVSFAPRLIPIILSSVAHPIASIRSAANETNYNLYNVIQSLPVPAATSPTSFSNVAQGKQPEPPTPTPTSRERNIPSSPPLAGVPFPIAAQPPPPTRIPSLAQALIIAQAPVSNLSAQFEQAKSDGTGEQSQVDTIGHSVFNIGAMVNALTLQFLNEQEETRVAALEWLLMLHRKAPKKILASDEPTLPQVKPRGRPYFDSSESGLSIALLLKMLSDPSEQVLRYDLQLLAQISSQSEDDGLPPLLISLLDLFSSDRRLLETRGSLVVRQLCLNLNSERLYRTFAEILEKEEDLEFASIMVQNLNLIMITSPELSDFRRRLKNLETKDGQVLFTILYRSWSHNAVATFSLCLLAQAYEQACSLLQIIAELEITVSLLIQLDKLVQLLESPVFTSLRLQLLEPDRHPFLLKAMYGVLMLLPQSSAFATLRNRLSAVSSLGFLQTVPKTYAATTAPRSNIRKVDEIRWNELLTHFRSVQKRRAVLSSSGTTSDSLDPLSPHRMMNPTSMDGKANRRKVGTAGSGIGGRNETNASILRGRASPVNVVKRTAPTVRKP